MSNPTSTTTMTKEEILLARLATADKAIKYVLDRAQTDADLGYQIGPFTESFALLCAAEAARTGEDVATVQARRGVSHARYPRRYLSRGEHEDAEIRERAAAVAESDGAA